MLGTADFWIYPRGYIFNSQNDMAQVLTGQLFLQRGPWAWPLLLAPNLGFPAGTNIFWIDAVPIVGLFAKLLAGIVHGPVNLLGLDLLACLVLPGFALTFVAWVAGHRNLLAAVVASAVADAAPLLLYRWGHIPLMAHYLILIALGLYLLSLRRPTDRAIDVTWLGLLTLTLLTNSYIFAMVGACWVASLLQRRINGAISTSRAVIHALIAATLLLGVMAAMGILTVGMRDADLAHIGAPGFGALSTNLGSLLVPQMSGVVPGMAHYKIGMGSQYEGFGYVGAGTLLLLLACLSVGVERMRMVARHHAVLMILVMASFLFALSNRVFLGSHVVFAVPLPGTALHLFGLFRSSGRFVWLPAYALMAGSLILVLGRPRSWWTAALCLTAATLQIVDAGPLRAAIAAAASGPVPAVFDRARVTALAARSRAIEAFPSYGCVGEVIAAGNDPDSDWDRLTHANVELQLIAARGNLPINSVYQSRLPTDCRAEANQRGAPLRPGVLYIYLDTPPPAAAQLGGRSSADICGEVDWMRYCLIPSAVQADGSGPASSIKASP
jgi:hypothetical protein